MSLPSPLRDHLFVQVNAASLDRTETGLYIPDWQPGDKDAVAAEVVAVPVGLSRERPLDYPGMDGRTYTYADLVDLPNIGDTVYLKPNTFKPDLEYPGHPGVFLVALDKVVAVAGAGGLRPFQGLLLCEEVYGDDVRARSDGVRERVHFTDLGATGASDGTHLYRKTILEVNPLPLPFTLRILHAGHPLRGQEGVVAEGDTIIAHRMLFAYHAVKQKDDEEASARWMHEPPKITIEGRDYAYCPRQCVMGKAEALRLWSPPTPEQQIAAYRSQFTNA
ncbi:MAG: hypothetical protein ACRYFX_18830 [Janthinobacterium lividum]